jgi:hypothetical protein
MFHKNMTQSKTGNGKVQRKRICKRPALLPRLMLFAAGFLVTSAFAFAQSSPPERTDTPSTSSPADRPDESTEPNSPSLMKPLKPVSQEEPYHPITPRQRLRWFITNTAGPPHLVGGLFVAGFGTALDRPEEYGTHWGGFGDRYGMRMTGIVTGNAMEASFGYLRGEDPRYFRLGDDRPLKERLRNVVRLTFMARLDDGGYGPAYARYIAVAGNNFLSNTWRVHSEANTHDALLRTAEGFAGRMTINAYEEFWPSVKKSVFHRHD